jgi:hypothetical protein
MLPAISKINELKREISTIANCPKADPRRAVEFAMALVGCYPGQQWADEKVAKHFMRKLSDCLAGVDLDVLTAMVDPKSGLVANSKKLPTIAEVHHWIENRMSPKYSRIGWYLDEIKRLEDSDEPEVVSPEERARRADMLKRASAAIKDAAYRKAPLKPIQAQEGPELNEARMAALRNLETMRRGAE